MKRTYIRQLSVAAISVLLLAVASSVSHAGRTSNPVELVVSGGYTENMGVSRTTRLYLDFGERFSDHEFWVKVEDNPGIPRDSGMTGPDGEVVPPVALPRTVAIKYFPISRYVDVIIAMTRIQTFGVVNPYTDGIVICDMPDSELRIDNRTINLIYNCGTGGPDADAATLQTEALIKSLAAETLSSPDIQGTIPQ